MELMHDLLILILYLLSLVFIAKVAKVEKREFAILAVGVVFSGGGVLFFWTNFFKDKAIYLILVAIYFEVFCKMKDKNNKKNKDSDNKE